MRNSIGSIQRRLKELEARVPAGMEIIAEDSSGKQQRMTVKEFCKRDNLGFVRVVGGNRFEDIDKILAWIEGKAYEQGS